MILTLKLCIMRKIRLIQFITTAFTMLLAVSVCAQEDIILDPAELVPADTGYYEGGVEKDKNDDGIMEFYHECDDEYGDASHNESSVQQGFTYNRCMIMPTCWPKDAIEDHTANIEHPEGYIELTKTKYIGTDSAVMGYIISPPVKNLVSLTLEVSPDVSYKTNPIYYQIEYSKDNGATWGDTLIVTETQSKDGEEHVYDKTDAEFQKMIDESKATSIVLRIMTKPQIQIGDNIEYASQRLKIHYLTIVAERASSVRTPFADKPKIKVFDHMIYSENSKISVYNTLGQFMGSGNTVSVKSGIYIIRAENGTTQKILIP